MNISPSPLAHWSRCLILWSHCRNFSGITPSPPGWGVWEQRMGQALPAPSMSRLISGISVCVSKKAKGKQQMCFDYWITQRDVSSNMESNYFVLHSGFKLREKNTSLVLIWLLSVLKWKFKVWTFPSLSFILWRKLLLTHPMASADHWWMVLRPAINFNSFRLLPISEGRSDNEHVLKWLTIPAFT